MIDKVKELLLGKTVESIELTSYQAPNDTLVLLFSDKSKIKIVSDPKMCFDGLAFYVVKNTSVEKDEEIK